MQKYVKSLEEAYQKQLQALAMDGLPAGAGSNFGLIPLQSTPTRNPQSNMDGLTDVQPMTMADSPQKRKGGRKGGLISILRPSCAYYYFFSNIKAFFLQF